MPVINASTSGPGGIQMGGDASGNLQLQSAGNTIATISSTGVNLSAAGLVFNDSTTQTSGSGAAKAWASFDGTGSIANLTAYNVSSVTRNSTGDYTINFTNALASANYSIIGMAGNSNQAQATNVSVKYGTGQQNGTTSPSLKSTTQCEIVLGIGNSTTYYDSYGISVAVFR